MEKSEIAKSWALERVGCPYIYGGTGQVCTTVKFVNCFDFATGNAITA